MIRYALKCSDGHGFESWFQSAEAYDKLARAGLVSCVVCGSSHVDKALMAPRVRPARAQTEAPEVAAPEAQIAQPMPTPPAQTQENTGALSGPPEGVLQQAMSRLRKEVEENSDYVGKDFAKEARAMYLGETPGRAIHGEAGTEEAKALIEDGIPVLPLPFLPNRKTN